MSWKRTLKWSIGLPLFVLWIAVCRLYIWLLTKRAEALRAENEYLRERSRRDSRHEL